MNNGMDAEPDLPRYCQTGDVLVKMVETADGGMDVLAYDPQTNSFRRDMRYLSLCFDPDEDPDLLTESEFSERVEKQRSKYLEGA